jgi:acyl-coenzyme A thioesterase PaaI-like protein
MLNKADIKNIIATKLPAVDQHGEIVERVTEREVRIRVPFKREYVGRDAWGTDGAPVFSGPMVMGLADSAMYACVHAAVGRDCVPVVVTLTVSFLRPARAVDLIAEARIVRRGRRLAYLEATLSSDGAPESIAHVVATYAVRGL